ncbi:hypothetical protein MPSEU_001036100 [Mayamaea pseudoterrestris]|nr:hypothetical protein MPSEU_001036100 [Mayamaea pseudoterrestris]
MGELTRTHVTSLDKQRPWNKGLRLTELADILLAQQVTFAIALDGGGSSVLTHYGRVVSQPMCMDVPVQCERAVATVVCITCQDNNMVVAKDMPWFPRDGRIPVADRYLTEAMSSIDDCTVSACSLLNTRMHCYAIVSTAFDGR